VTYRSPADEQHRLSGAELRAAVLAFATNPIYLDGEHWENDDNPYRRQLRPQDLRYLDFTTPLRRDQVLRHASLAAQRMLTCIYEADLVLLPQSELTPGTYEDFRSFYSSDNRARGEAIRPALEAYAFAFLEDEVIISGAWNTESLEVFLRELDGHDRNVLLATEKAIRHSDDPRRAARMWLIQRPPGLLSMASAMLGTVLGTLGEPDPEWSEIVIGRYGHGMHDAAHRTRYEHTLASVGLRQGLHHYWQYYLPGSLLMSNYFHYLGRNHELFFRYLGALFHAESTLADFSARAAALLTDVFDGAVDVKCFTEHAATEAGNGRTVLENLVLPVVQRCGPAVIPEILRGYQQAQIVAELAEEDFVAQISWMDEGKANKRLYERVYRAVLEAKVDVPVVRIAEPYGELSTTHSHQGDQLCHIVSGTMRFVSGFQSQQVLEAGEGIIIWRNRLHGAIIESDECVYELHSVGDYRTFL
jgi:quercetin dioxygenase-like cupin family protein